MAYRARSASDRTDDWPFWYITDDHPANRNATPKAWQTVTGKDWPPKHQFLPREEAVLLADAANILDARKEGA